MHRLCPSEIRPHLRGVAGTCCEARWHALATLPRTSSAMVAWSLVGSVGSVWRAKECRAVPRANCWRAEQWYLLARGAGEIGENMQTMNQPRVLRCTVAALGAIAILGLALAGCSGSVSEERAQAGTGSGSESSGGASSGGESGANAGPAGCPGSKPADCVGGQADGPCGDLLVKAVCNGGHWLCPSGTVSPDQCGCFMSDPGCRVGTVDGVCERAITPAACGNRTWTCPRGTIPAYQCGCVLSNADVDAGASGAAGCP